MKTNESHVKKMVKEQLRTIPDLWYYMPVSLGMGVHGIPDFIGCYKGMSFFIETKAPGKQGHANKGMSALQVLQKQKIEAAGGMFFLVDGPETFVEFKQWIAILQSKPYRS